ncbi:HAD-superfamily hydrolase, subfamily IG, 5-nucleotidase [Sesbania bispinosa]|nr:HAD-superfamily hydrolase, subfamily IG, 5-nucleotidase [Sesbania bispinosa]
MKMMFNTLFGATFLTSTGQESAFAYNIHQYADVYTSKPENFLLHSPEAWLHVPYDVKIMPHHVKVRHFLFINVIYVTKRHALFSSKIEKKIPLLVTMLPVFEFICKIQLRS